MLQSPRDVQVYLLTDPGSLSLFKLGPLMDVLNWVKPTVLFVRLHDARERAYREHAVTDAAGKFVRFERVYDSARTLTRVVLSASAAAARPASDQRAITVRAQTGAPPS